MPFIIDGRVGNVVWWRRGVVITARHVLEDGIPGFFGEVGARPTHRFMAGDGRDAASDWAVWTLSVDGSPWLDGREMPETPPALATYDEALAAWRSGTMAWLVGYDAPDEETATGVLATRDRMLRVVPCRLEAPPRPATGPSGGMIRIRPMESLGRPHGYSGSGIYLPGPDGTCRLLTIAARSFGGGRVIAGPALYELEFAAIVETVGNRP